MQRLFSTSCIFGTEWTIPDRPYPTRAPSIKSEMDGNPRELESTSANDALFVERQRAQITLDSIGDGVISTDMEGRVTYLNVVAETMTG